MSEKKITFEEMPKVMSWMMDKLNELGNKLDNLNHKPPVREDERWMNLKEVCDYIPSHPAEQTVYGWTSTHYIPYHKKGRRLLFLKSEIDDWLHQSKIKSRLDMMKEAQSHVQANVKYNPSVLKNTR